MEWRPSPPPPLPGGHVTYLLLPPDWATQPPHPKSDSKVISWTKIAEPPSQKGASLLWAGVSGAQGNGKGEMSELRGAVPGAANIPTLWCDKNVRLPRVWVGAMGDG